MSSINFVNAYWLFLAIPLCVLFTVPFFLSVRKGNRNWHNIASYALHIVMAVLVAFSAAGANIAATLTETDVYVLADVSYSSNRNLGLIDDYIGEIASNLPDNSRMGIVCFGKDQKILTQLGQRRRRVSEAQVDGSETDIIGALEYTGTLFRDGVIKRIVVVTDGAQTYMDDPNALRRTVDKLAGENIKVDAVFLNNNLGDGERELQISSVTASQSVFADRREEAQIYIQSSYQTSAILTLYRDGEEYGNRVVQLSVGMNSVSFPLDTEQAGTYEYSAVITPSEEGGDGNLFNNEWRFSQTVTDERNILLITDKPEDYAAVDAIYGAKANIDGYYGYENVPITVEELSRYDEIVLADVDLRSLPDYELFLENLNYAVTLFGKSLLTVGNVALQNDADAQLSVLSGLLPVRFGRNESLPKLYTIVIDTSSSMAQLDKLSRAKAAAKHLVDSLEEDDEVAVVWFNGNSGYVQRHTRVGDEAKRAEIKADIDAQWVEHGTEIKLGFNEVKGLIGLEFSEKQVMLISDGLDLNVGGSDYESPLGIVDELRQNRIYTSVIDVGRGNDTSTTASRAKQLLENIASGAHGGGKYYLAATNEDLQDVVFDSIDEDLQETVVERFTNIEVNRSRDELLNGVTLSPEDYIWGFVNNRAKPDATTVLTAKHKKQGVNIDVPVYAYCVRGNGKVASFTSSFEWADTLGYEKRNALFYNMFETMIPSEKADYPFTVEVLNDDAYLTVNITPAAVRLEAEVQVRVVFPSGDTVTGNLVWAGAGYSYAVAMRELGKYEVTVTYSYGGYDYTPAFNVYLPYYEEYDSFKVFDRGTLISMVGENGQSVDGKDVADFKIENNVNEVGMFTLDLAAPLLIVAVVLFVIDIVIRKIKWEDVVSLFKKVKK